MSRVGTFDAEQEFRDNYRTQSDVGRCLCLNPGDELRLILPQPADASVGIEQIRHDSGSRSSSGSCGGRSNVGSVMLPATDWTYAAHSAGVMDLPTDSITTCTG